VRTRRTLKKRARGFSQVKILVSLNPGIKTTDDGNSSKKYCCTCERDENSLLARAVSQRVMIMRDRDRQSLMNRSAVAFGGCSRRFFLMNGRIMKGKGVVRKIVSMLLMTTMMIFLCGGGGGGGDTGFVVCEGVINNGT